MNTHTYAPSRNLALVFSLSLAVALLMAVASLGGLLLPGQLYPSQALRQAFLANDVVNLVLGLPVLLGALFLAQKGKLAGHLFWPGALLFVTYNYIAYAVAIPFPWQRGLYLALALLSGWLVFRLVTNMDRQQVQAALRGAVPERLAGGVLAGLGLLFFMMRAGPAFQVIGGQVPVTPEGAVAVADLLIMPLWILGGGLLWRKHPVGYVSGAGLLFQGSMLFIGLLVFFILQPVVAGVPFPLVDFMVIAGMGLVCFVPFGLFLRGIQNKTGHEHFSSRI